MTNAHYLEQFGFIRYARATEIIKEILSDTGSIKGSIGDSYVKEITDISRTDLWTNINGLLVQNTFIDYGIDEDYLNTPIQEKFVYAPSYGFIIGLPCSIPIKYLVLDSSIEDEIASNNLILEESTGMRKLYKRVLFEEEITISDLYKNAYKYQYQNTTKSFIRLSEDDAKQQLIKYLISSDIFEIGGFPNDRLADYGRIILFLLTKVSLTENELNAFSSLLNYAPDISSMEKLIARETEIQARVSEAKNDPIAFVNNY